MYYTQRVHIIFISKRGSLPSLKILINMFISPFGCQCIKNNQFNDILIYSWYLSMFPHILKQCLSFRVDISNRVLQMGILTLRKTQWLGIEGDPSILLLGKGSSACHMLFYMEDVVLWALLKLLVFITLGFQHSTNKSTEQNDITSLSEKIITPTLTLFIFHFK